MNTKIQGYTIDTCYTADCGYETAIWHDKLGSMVIVERYSNKEEAKIGHEKWVKYCKKRPKTAFSVQFNEEDVLRK